MRELSISLSTVISQGVLPREISLFGPVQEVYLNGERITELQLTSLTSRGKIP